MTTVSSNERSLFNCLCVAVAYGSHDPPAFGQETFCKEAYFEAVDNEDVVRSFLVSVGVMLVEVRGCPEYSGRFTAKY